MPAPTTTPNRFTPPEIEALKSAADQLDALWDLDAERGMRDGRGGMEYEHELPTHVIRQMLAASS